MRFHFWGVHRSTVSGSGCDGLGLRHSNKVACLAFLVGENIGDLGAGDDGAAPGCFVTDTGPGFVMMSGDVGGVQRSTTSAGLAGRAGEDSPSSANASFFLASILFIAAGSGSRPAANRLSSEAESCDPSRSSDFPENDSFLFDPGVCGIGVLATDAGVGAAGGGDASPASATPIGAAARGLRLEKKEVMSC
jgi:hypothetical protein